MAPRKWDPYLVLNMTARGSHGMNCFGINRYGKRCRWDIPKDRFTQLCALMAEIETMPPSDVSSFLPEIAHLSLCQDWHQNQASEVISNWQSSLREAARDYEKSEGRQSQAKALERMLEEEAKQRQDITSQMLKLQTQLQQRQDLSSQVIDLQAQLQQERNISARYTKACTQFEEVSKTLSTRLEEVRSQLAVSTKESQTLAGLLDHERSEFSVLLHKERQAVDEYKGAVNARLDHQSRTIEDLRSKSEADSQLSMQRLRDLDEVKTQHAGLLSESQTLQAQLTAQREASTKQGKELDKVTTEQAETVSRCEGLQAQLSAECQTSSTLRTALEQAGDGHALLSKELETARSQLATELQRLEPLRNQLTTLQGKLTGTQRTLEATQADLENGRQTHNKEHGAAAARDAASAAERARLVEQIGRLETQLSTSVRKTWAAKLKRLVAGSMRGRKAGTPRVGGLEAA